MTNGTPATHAQSQEHEERFYLNAFLSLLQFQPDGIERGPLIDGANLPDFILHLGSDEVGVEMTTFHSEEKGADGSPRRAVEEAWENTRSIFQKERESYPELNKV